MNGLREFELNMQQADITSPMDVYALSNNYGDRWLVLSEPVSNLPDLGPTPSEFDSCAPWQKPPKRIQPAQQWWRWDDLAVALILVGVLIAVAVNWGH